MATLEEEMTLAIDMRASLKNGGSGATQILSYTMLSPRVFRGCIALSWARHHQDYQKSYTNIPALLSFFLKYTKAP